jgi:hypothetical protein
MRQLVIGLAVLSCGFSAGAQFDQDPVMTDGAGGIAFNGAPRWISHTCAVCHTNAPGQISIALEADHPELFSTGYTAGMQYHLRVVLQGEHEGVAYKANGQNCGFGTDPFAPCDLNGYSLEIDDQNGNPRGTYALVEGSDCAVGSGNAPDANSYILADGTASLFGGAPDLTAWDVCWTAPSSNEGTLTAYVAVVDGDGGGGGSNFPTGNTTGDDVAAGQVPILQAGATTGSQGGGCNAAGDAGGLGIALALLGLHRRRRGVLAAAPLVLVLAGGCVHVRPRERETLAKRAMKFSPDPAEDQLDLHMQEAREGSEGGYGTSGGGCGCN